MFPWLPVSNLVNPPARPVYPVIFMALPNVAPVHHVHATVGTVSEIDGAEVGVGRFEEIFAVGGGVAGSFADEFVPVDPLAVQVDGEHVVAVLGWEIVA